jgi:hypothetical protein
MAIKPAARTPAVSVMLAVRPVRLRFSLRHPSARYGFLAIAN